MCNSHHLYLSTEHIILTGISVNCNVFTNVIYNPALPSFFSRQIEISKHLNKNAKAEHMNGNRSKKKPLDRSKKKSLLKSLRNHIKNKTSSNPKKWDVPSQTLLLDKKTGLATLPIHYITYLIPTYYIIITVIIFIFVGKRKSNCCLRGHKQLV